MNPLAFTSPLIRSLLVALLVIGFAPTRGSATDVDPPDCNVSYRDFGDAPENIQAYPTGVIGRFPTCVAGSPAGTQEIDCGLPVSSFPLATGFVMHRELAIANNFWLGCYPGPQGLDADLDGKVSLIAVPGSGCLQGVPDCIAGFGGLSFGQDECFADGSDAGLTALPSLVACGTSHVDLRAYSCGVTLKVYLNVLVDWNQDGDWNDKIACGAAACAREWAVKNAPFFINPGCTSITSPNFRVGPNAGPTWMRITLSYDQVNDDFPWAGSTTMASQYLHGGETEDYPLTILPGQLPTGCQIQYFDFGDAPEGIPAYPSGILGHFPTCTQDTDPGNQTAACVPPPGTVPGLTGFVRHIQTFDDVDGLWLGCNAAEPPYAVDSEVDGKVSLFGGTFSRCNDVVPIDCFQSFAAGFSFGQDECYGDLDAGLAARISFPQCGPAVVNFRARACSEQPITAYLNVLVDWNQDGDWNDVDLCPGRCAPEWALKNEPITVNPGCQPMTSPGFQVGSQIGAAWMRITLSLDPVPDEFPWLGSAGLAGQSLRGGETEDYPVDIVTPTSVGANPNASGLWLAAEPSPARTSTALKFGLPRAGHASLVVYDLVGRRIRGLVDGKLETGPHQESWDLRDDQGVQVPAGTYFVKLRAGERTLTSTVIRIK